MKKLLTRSLDTFFLIRPVLLIPVWGFCAFGYWQTGDRNLMSLWHFWTSTPLSVYLDIFTFSLSVGSVYILNQIADIEVDKKNGGLPLLASGISSIKTAWIGAIILFIISCIIPVLENRIPLALYCCASVILGFFYSFKPTIFSGRPILDFLSNATGYGIIAFGAGMYLGSHDQISLKLVLNDAIPYFLLMCAGSISSTLPDRAGDADEGKITTAVLLGDRKAHLLATALLLCALALSIIKNDTIAIICSIAPLPVYLTYIVKPSTVLMEATYKVGGAFTMICACLILPFILPAGIIVFLLTKLYFRVRHNVDYPSLVPVR